MSARGVRSMVSAAVLLIGLLGAGGTVAAVVEDPLDSDADGILDEYEMNPSGEPRDTDGDGAFDHLDADDDGDSVPTRFEDTNHNGDFFDDDADGDRVVDYLDADDDNDGVPTRLEDADGDGAAILDDTDGDGLPNRFDLDDDGDDRPTRDEDIDADGDWWDDDEDLDGVPAFLDPDDAPVGPDAPTITFAAAVDTGVIELRFTAGDDGTNPTTHFIASCTDDSTGTQRLVEVAQSPARFTAMPAGELYHCWVQGVSGTLRGDSSSVSQVRVANPPGTPSVAIILSATSRAISIEVSRSVTDTDGVEGAEAVCRSTDGRRSSTATMATYFEDPTSFDVTGLTPGVTYRCTARVWNVSGEATSNPSSSTVTIPALADPPRVTSALHNIGTRTATITLQTPANATATGVTQYRAVCSSSTPGATQRSGSVYVDDPDQAVAITVTSLTAGATYTCAARAVSTSGASRASASSSPFSVPPAPPAPDQPSVATTATARQVSVTPTVGAAGDGVQRRATCTSEDGGTTRTSTWSTNTSLLVSSLSRGRTYVCSVVARNAYGASAASPPSSPITIA
jgi:hypothetical protein